MIYLILLSVLIVIILIFLISIKNNFVTLDNQNKEAWSNIKVYLQKRLDLIPNLVNTVKGYSKHEKETLEKVIEARSRLVNIDLSNIDNIEKIKEYDNMLTNALRHISMLSESYPDLKADKEFLKLQSSLSEIEEDVLNSRRYYNATCRNLNIFIEKFPNSMFYNLFKFRKAIFFEEGNDNKNYDVKVEF
ncbi:LemA family protein [Oceanivirga miroungae]|uniref:LemA family protein n=1 Tax=Oceanivirga miroungae TaxID=1130046 RepID=A0A6I8MAD9_9FUSO|nr:LemA family protein [Oceanivirga miroungae]VWL85132.1 LemA family protein [Oceanivirga miroungae]